jgi:hypothetical protein
MSPWTGDRVETRPTKETDEVGRPQPARHGRVAARAGTVRDAHDRVTIRA